MLQQAASAHPMIAVRDLDVAKTFYTGVLGLAVAEERAGMAIRYEMRGASWFLVYQSEFAGTAKNTCMRFEVDDVGATVDELRERGVVLPLLARPCATPAAQRPP